eukprot:m.1170113 g.1170113  ORF g.1170113 m.1170113 type:complete len:416 (+) comp24510_c0_seq11:65-1312(+)
MAWVSRMFAEWTAVVLFALFHVSIASSESQWMSGERDTSPMGLLVDFKRIEPSGIALGVSAVPVFTWIVPSCVFPRAGVAASRSMIATDQVAYRIVLRREDFQTGSGELELTDVWDSGQIFGNSSVNVAYNGTEVLQEASVYQWNVTTWTSAHPSNASFAVKSSGPLCQSTPSKPARFATALAAPKHPSLQFASSTGWSGAQWIWSAPTEQPLRATVNRFTFLRRDIAVDGNHPACIHAGTRHGQHLDAAVPDVNVSVSRALLFVTAAIDPTMLSAYKVFVDGVLVALGPGRGEAYIRDLDPTPSANPYDVVDITTSVNTALATRGAGTVVLGVQGQAPMGDTRWNSWDPIPHDLHMQPSAVLLKLRIVRSDGTTCTVVSDNTSWRAKGMWLAVPPCLSCAIGEPASRAVEGCAR